MTDDKLIDAQVRAARERGDFDNLKGHGKPLELDELAGLSPEQRFEALLYRSAAEVMPEAALAREIRAGRLRLTLSLPDEERALLQQSVDSKISELTAVLKARKADQTAR